MSAFWRGVRQFVRQRPEVDERVPELSRWDSRGIVGTIGIGENAGLKVLALKEVNGAGKYVSYLLELPFAFIENPDSSIRMENGIFDDNVPGESGGLIDELTRAFDVTWSCSSADVDAYFRDLDR